MIGRGLWRAAPRRALDRAFEGCFETSLDGFREIGPHRLSCTRTLGLELGKREISLFVSPVDLCCINVARPSQRFEMLV
jgi:hypothetical protein